MQDELAELFQRQLQISKEEILHHDVNYMLWVVDNEQPSLHLKTYKLKANLFESITELYEAVLQTLKQINRINDLLEIMPLIDDYLEYYLSL